MAYGRLSRLPNSDGLYVHCTEGLFRGEGGGQWRPEQGAWRKKINTKTNSDGLVVEMDCSEGKEAEEKRN